MIGCFPDPYPDELLYSVCARFHDRVQYPNKKNTMRELFGDEAAIATVGLPSNLQTLVSMLPPGSPYTVERLINNHTLYPFYAPFLDCEQARQLWADMEGARGPSIYMRSGIMASTIQPMEWLRFCPVCAQEDKELLGEYYWHRIHQLPGIEVCPEHNVRVLDSKIRIQNPQTRHEFVSADRGTQLPRSRSYKLFNSHQAVLLRIAQDAAWLLKHQPLIPGLDILAKRYRELLAERDLATYSGRVRVSELLNQFCECYSPELLKYLQCQIDVESQHNWLFRLVRSPKGSQHPLRHLLLMQFLGHTAESFFKLPQQFKPFGKGPWLCLNKAADHFRKPVITECELAYSKEHGKPIGTFSCSCGFVYSRTGPDESEEDTLRITKIRAFGSVWEDALKTLWYDSSVSLREIARQLGVDAATIKLHAAALELEFPRPGKRQTTRMSRTLARPLEVEPGVSEASLHRYRREWLTARQVYPEAGRTALKKQFQRVYTWLYRNDREWLEAHLPPRMAKSPPPVRVDWEHRDIELADAARQAAIQLQTRPGKPTQITIAAVGRQLGQLALIQRHLDKLPVTAQVLSELVETREAFALRRIQWVVECYREEGICPQRWQLVRRAGLRPEIEGLPVVQKALDEAVESLKIMPLQYDRDRSPQRLAF
ncbi:TnsD family Tn7-like transposition protein [Stenomitos frigidus]|uniref:Transposase n=1 Tax=Stenomitos frigidus ULC18 TaxID=2107698 RepID=A0A2T1ENT1_9CYAN|nr:TnsD family Tn7-like transposition protein [Stenomitos frigidus]PSB34402.1 transposase [Stenomitos frigidus ULC18]